MIRTFWPTGRWSLSYLKDLLVVITTNNTHNELIDKIHNRCLYSVFCVCPVTYMTRSTGLLKPGLSAISAISGPSNTKSNLKHSLQQYLTRVVCLTVFVRRWWRSPAEPRNQMSHLHSKKFNVPPFLLIALFVLHCSSACWMQRWDSPAVFLHTGLPSGMQCSAKLYTAFNLQW